MVLISFFFSFRLGLQLGYVVLLDPRWTVKAMGEGRTQYAKNAEEVMLGLQDRGIGHRSPDFKSRQESYIQALLALAVVYGGGGGECARFIDEFIQSNHSGFVG